MNKYTVRIVVITLVVILAAFSAVQTYRVHELSLRLTSLPSSVSVTDRRAGTVVQSPKPVEHPVVEAPKSVASQETATVSVNGALSVDEALLKRERERLREALSTTSGKPSSEAQGTGRDTGKQAASNASAEAPGKKNTPGDTGGKANKEEEAKRQQAKRVAESEALTQAQGAMQRGAYDDAVAILKQGLQADPTSRDLNVTLGGVYHRLRQYDAELQTYLDWIAQSPGEAYPHYEAAQTYVAMGKSPEALQELSRFLDSTQQINKKDMNVYPMVASIYRSLGMSADEGAVLQTWAQEAPNELNVHRVLADYYSRTGDTQAALTEYQGIAQQVPMDADAHRNLGGAYRRVNMSQEAESEFVTAISLQPQNMNTRLQLAELYRQNKNYEAALQTYTDIVNAAPNTPEAEQAGQMITHVQAQVRAATPPQ